MRQNPQRLFILIPACLAMSLIAGCGGGSGWSSAWSQAGDVRVRIDSAVVKKPMMLTASGKEHEDQVEMLVLHITVENKSGEPLTYRRWEAMQLSAGSSLKDEHGKTYRNRMFSTTNAAGGVKGSSTTIAAGGQLVDVLLFDPPAEGATNLKLTLASQFGTKDTLQFEIPASAWK